MFLKKLHFRTKISYLVVMLLDPIGSLYIGNIVIDSSKPPPPKIDLNFHFLDPSDIQCLPDQPRSAKINTGVMNRHEPS